MFQSESLFKKTLLLVLLPVSYSLYNVIYKHKTYIVLLLWSKTIVRHYAVRSVRPSFFSSDNSVPGLVVFHKLLSHYTGKSIAYIISFRASPWHLYLASLV